MQVFDVAVNQHTVIKGLDIYERVGRAVGHDEYIPFRVNDNQLLLDGETLPFNGLIYVEFLKVCINIAIIITLATIVYNCPPKGR